MGILSRQHSRKKLGSQNREKARLRLARLHYRITCIRKDAHQKASSAILKRASTIVLETLNVNGMLKNRRLSQALSDAAIYSFQNVLTLKARASGVAVLKAPLFWPSSKYCSGCGGIKVTLLLNERTYHCEHCGLSIDRDLNAAINLRNLAGGSSVSACGPEGSGSVASVAERNHVGMKQESGVAA